MADLSAVVALLSLGAVPGHVAVTSAGVAGLSTLTETTLLETTLLLESTLVAVTGNVSDLATLVALGSAATLLEPTLGSWLLALTGEMAWLVALVASLLLWSSCALTAYYQTGFPRFGHSRAWFRG
ncbi:hypothetical protein BJ508DRAFT_163710 [Ascobolus immersus RN42]|uniref:Sodium/calcium exchanger membrane region domain-containing protein n=1 Tax=Ascobolus immersus RN42 TaxID=1160509 RepID=A0A3N4I154_ASCIM|nr:hypothetical protein BJ508DRAFT_163710 [Ascobolus immersus RN42]